MTSTAAWIFERMAMLRSRCMHTAGRYPMDSATRYFDMADDGLAQEWSGRVWMNPLVQRTVALGRPLHRPR